jgi:rare lipoprotein A|tara:strand:+ start:140 stop:1042 length:903 start_codon:yes stop_codon:yes gene_type:complete
MKFKISFKFIKKFFVHSLAFFILASCTETTFLINSAKRMGSWGDDPIYKVGNPYKINGKWYYPAINYDYDEIGMASWYGPGFHGKKTANGEIFNQNIVSAAHRTLPLPSIVKVTNLDNGKVLSFVRVNDRGPFARNRIIDLSKEAAKQLGFVNKGVAKVRVEILEDESRKFVNELVKSNKNAKAAVVQEVEKKDLSVNSNKSFKSNNKIIKDNVDDELDENFVLKNNDIAIQVGAFSDHRNAKSLIEKLSEFKAYIKREFIDNKYIYRVRIGPLGDLSEANQLKDKLFDLGYTSSHLVMN